MFVSGLLIVLALVVGILAGHFGWGRRLGGNARLHPDYLAGLDYLVAEQPDRALDMFLKLMDADAETIETHFALGALYRRRGEVERATRIHQSLLARPALLPEHREQALLALARDYLRAGVLDRAEQLFKEVSQVPRLRADALDSLRRVYEQQREWGQALWAYRELRRAGPAPGARVGAHYLCELAEQDLEQGEVAGAQSRLREACAECMPCPRASLLRATIAQRGGDVTGASRHLGEALRESPVLLQEQLARYLQLEGAQGEKQLAELVQLSAARGLSSLKALVFAACGAHLEQSPALDDAIATVFERDESLRLLRHTQLDTRRLAGELGALLAHAERYRCNQCGFASHGFFWQCPACHAWDSFESHAAVKLY